MPRRHSTDSWFSTSVEQLLKKRPELLIYRLEFEMVYVKPGRNFEKALSYAQAVFPQLADVARSRIVFSVEVRVSGDLRTVRIAPMAWSRVLRSITTYEIIDISVIPYATSSHRPATGDDALPKHDDNDKPGIDLRHSGLDI